ncbi:MFS transporter [Defluviimonas aestuarii]|uniref:MFS transporter n=1 Tax=Albidovulum aestuarii TaxID=1130726 RepID=UPI00249B873B|nr:MFS transporter [Defluviimonas aestuarii]MDI3338479.1 MFS transporter [Defluviimonas aestuarii]
MTVSARKRIWGWWFFDWASQPYNTLLLTFIFGPYFAKVATAEFMAAGLTESVAKAEAQAYWGFGLSICGIAIAILSPILGAIADGSGRRMVWIWFFSLLYVVGALGVWQLTPEAPMLAQAVFFFGIGFIAMEFATTFTNALMPSLVEDEKLGSVSGSGFAFGYLGGLIALIIMLLFFAENGDTGRTLIGLAPAFGLDPSTLEGTRFVGPFSAIWFIVFMIPFFLWVREPKRPAGMVQRAGAALTGLWQSIRGLTGRRSLAAYLGSSMFYRDALNGLFGFGGVYASGVLNWSITQIGIFGILGGVTAALASWLGGYADQRFGPKPVIKASILVLIAVCCIVAGMNRESIVGIAIAANSALPDVIFYVCGGLIGAAGGTIQAASRTLMVRHTTPDRAAEAFGLFALSGKATSFLAPGLIAIMSTMTGSQQLGITPLIGLFLIGLVLLVWVKPDGDRGMA